MGNYSAKEELNRIQIWKANEEQKKNAERARRQRESYTPRTESHSYSSSSSSGCFVITAANSSLNLLDRWGFKRLLSWKNTLKKESPLIARLLEDYDRFAPVVVSKIDAEKNLKNLYGELWDKFISKVYELVCQKKYYDAARVYADMMKTLCSRYHLEIPEDTRKELDCLLFTQ
ncbi:MAG: hypothetical protein IJR43_01850 [Synergistaceae bacterium]|nr:hypothetical protein [Synergistaceae bacterium]